MSLDHLDQPMKLRDLDNRDEDGSPFVVIGDLVTIVTYLDGPVRGDLTDPNVGGDDLDSAINRLADHDLDGANAILNGRFCVYVEALDRYEDFCPTCDAPNPTHTPECAVVHSTITGELLDSSTDSVAS